MVPKAAPRRQDLVLLVVIDDHDRGNVIARIGGAEILLPEACLVAGIGEATAALAVSRQIDQDSHARALADREDRIAELAEELERVGLARDAALTELAAARHVGTVPPDPEAAPGLGP